MQQSLNVKKGEGSLAGKVQIACGGKAVAPHWRFAKWLGRELIRPGTTPSDKPGVIDVLELPNGHVDVLLHGALWFNASLEDARRIGQAILQVANLVEEEEDHARITHEQAILTRSGAPFGLTNHPAILAEAKKEAEGNRDLRRFMAPAFRGRTMVGLPVLQQFSPNPRVAARQRAEHMTPEQKRADIAQLEKEIRDGHGN